MTGPNTTGKGQGSLIEEQPNADGLDAKVFVGVNPWHPYIAEVVRQVVDEGPNRRLALQSGSSRRRHRSGIDASDGAALL